MLMQMFIFYIPLAYIGSYLMGLLGIFIAGTTAHLLAGVIAYGVLRWAVTMEERKAMKLVAV